MKNARSIDKLRSNIDFCIMSIRFQERLYLSIGWWSWINKLSTAKPLRQPRNTTLNWLKSQDEQTRTHTHILNHKRPIQLNWLNGKLINEWENNRMAYSGWHVAFNGPIDSNNLINMPFSSLFFLLLFVFDLVSTKIGQFQIFCILYAFFCINMQECDAKSLVLNNFHKW